MELALLDTDILSEILKERNQRVLDAGSDYLAEHESFSFSAITFYEIVRGFLANNSKRALAKFLALAGDANVIEISIPVLRRAASLWAEARRGGHPRDDADLIIAATALESRRVLVTGNRAHFAWIHNLELADWRSGGQSP